MNRNELAAMKQAIKEAFCEMKIEKIGERIWQAARAYEEPPAVCGAIQPNCDYSKCTLPSDHAPLDHRREFDDGSYVGWPREVRRMQPCGDRSISSSNYHYDVHDENELCGQPHYRCEPVRKPDPYERCASVCGRKRGDHNKHSHAFVSPKEAKE